MFLERIPLKTDQNCYYFIDQCVLIFEHVLQFLMCGKLVLSEDFNQLKLLQMEANFCQIEDLVSAVEHHQRDVEVKKGDEAPILLLGIFKKGGFPEVSEIKWCWF